MNFLCWKSTSFLPVLFFRLVRFWMLGCLRFLMDLETFSVVFGFDLKVITRLIESIMCLNKLNPKKFMRKRGDMLGKSVLAINRS